MTTPSNYATTFENIRLSEIPKRWRDKLKANSKQMFDVAFIPKQEPMQDDDLPMPPEEMIRPEYIAELKQLSKDIKSGKEKTYTARNEKEVKELFNQWMNE